MADGVHSAPVLKLVETDFDLELAPILLPRMAALIVLANRLKHATRKTVRVIGAKTCEVVIGILYRFDLRILLWDYSNNKEYTHEPTHLFVQSLADSLPHSRVYFLMLAPVDGGWSDFSVCTRTCAGGIQIRTCSNPAPANGGADCTGQSLQICNTRDCPRSTSTDCCLDDMSSCYWEST